ncbi:MAG TPA: hypothetical protein VMW24_18825 [Sedimentisphaerales bacterium]|nr:hypothetical protein [Sedimentisphaerales bacterium]
MMVERLIYEILEAGVAWFSADLRRVEAFFIKKGLSATEAAKVRTYYSRDPDAGEAGGPPNIVQGYPRTTGPFPCFCIVLVGDPFSQTFLGDDIDDELAYDGTELPDGLSLDTDLDGNEARRIGRILSYQFDVECWAQDNPDICLYYYHLLRYIIFSSLSSFEEAGLDQVEYAGRDINPNERFMPENMWVRSIRLSMIGEEKTWETLGAGRTIGGAHVEGSVEDDTDVTRNIVPYTAE